MGRSLRIIPIIHDEADLGRLAGTVREAVLAKVGPEALERKRAVVEAAWDAIEAWAGTLGGDLSRVKLYQDGLPVSEHADRIVEELAGQGSRNHRLLRSLIARGARLEGTEDPRLLIKEYEAVKAALAIGRTPPASRELLAQRDRFIAQRINQTLGVGETGVLFIGMLHEVGPGLSPDIEVTTPIAYERSAQAG